MSPLNTPFPSRPIPTRYLCPPASSSIPMEERYKPYYRAYYCYGPRKPLYSIEQRRRMCGKRQRGAPGQRPEPLPEPAWAPEPPPEHSARCATELEHFIAGEARFCTHDAALAAQLRAYGCYQRPDGSFIESYAADLALWLRLSDTQRLAARLHDWTRPQGAAPLQHHAPRSVLYRSDLEHYGVDAAGQPLEMGVRHISAAHPSFLGVTVPTNRADAATAAERLDDSVPDYGERGVEPDWLYGAVYNQPELLWERAEARWQDEEEFPWLTSGEGADGGDGGQDYGSSAQGGERREPFEPVEPGTAGLDVCDRCGVPAGMCDCATRYGVSARYLVSDTAPLQLTDAKRKRILEKRRHPGETAEDREAHEHRIHAQEAGMARKARRAEEQRHSWDALVHAHRVRLPYQQREALAWNRGWQQPSPRPRRPILNRPPAVLVWEHGRWWKRPLDGEAEEDMTHEQPAVRHRGRPPARPRKTPVPGCIHSYRQTDRSWQARIFRRLFPWGLPRAYLDGPYGWQRWMAAEAALRHRKRVRYRHRKAPYDVARPVMESAVSTRLERELRSALSEAQKGIAEQLEWDRRVASHQTYKTHKTVAYANRSSFPCLQPGQRGNVDGETSAVSVRGASSAASTIAQEASRAMERRYEELLTCPRQSAWIPPEELLPEETGLWLPTHQVAKILGIKSDSVSAWHRRHPEVQTDKNGVREHHYRLEDVIQRANEKARATDRSFPWRRPPRPSTESPNS